MSNRFFPNVGKIYSPHVMPVIIDTSFVVNSADTAGYGVTGVTGAGIGSVYMHTSATPAAGSPNPANGYIQIQLKDNYTAFLAIDSCVASPNSGTPILINTSTNGLTIGKVYVITVLGSATLANWVALGLPQGLTPTVGQAFVAKAIGAGSDGTAAVQAPAAAGSGIDHIEVVGLPNTEFAPIGIFSSPVQGAYILLQCLGATNSTTTTLTPTQPANGSTIYLTMFLNNSSARGGAAGQ